MSRKVVRLFLEDRMAQVLAVLFVGLFVWWGYVYAIKGGLDQNANLAWAASYQVLAILGGIIGIVVSKGWGGFRSVMGRSIISFSVGLLLQSFGQSVFSFYNLFLHVDVPYPSIADIGFFGSIPLYIYGILLLAKASGAAISLRSFGRKIQAIIIPTTMLVVSYYFFLRGYDFSSPTKLQIFLDFGYPLGQAIYISIAILTYILSRGFFGGVMRGKVMVILLALVIQYVSDYNFLYQNLNGTWQNGGYGDMLYMVAYMFMALGLLQLKAVYIRSKDGL